VITTALIRWDLSLIRLNKFLLIKMVIKIYGRSIILGEEAEDISPASLLSEILIL